MEDGMAFEFNGDRLFKEAAIAQSKGCKIVRDYGILPDGLCACGNPDHRAGGAAEKQCGKHPRGLEWGDKAAADEDTLWRWVEEAKDTGVPFNIGILLGPRSGVIDMEWDDEKAKAYAETMNLVDIETPTYISGRSEHRLFKWDDRLAGCQAVVKPGGLEVRLGTGDKDAQSVLPRFAEDGPARAMRQVREQRGPGTELRYVQPGQNRTVCGYVGRTGQRAAVAFVSRPSRILFSDDPLTIEFREARERYCPDLMQAPTGTG
jgi:hypothetical protein